MARRLKRQNDAARAIRLQAQGHTHAQIADLLDVARKSVAGLLVAGRQHAPDDAVDWHANQQGERLRRCGEALRLQRSGLTRRAIADAMSCSTDSVPDLLKDARFYEDPSSDATRWRRAQECHELRGRGLAKEQIIDALGGSRITGLRAYRDVAVLMSLGRLQPTVA